MTYFHVIDGALAASERWYDVLDPATGKAFAQAPDADRHDLDRAVKGARRAFAVWSKLGFEGRRSILMKFATRLRDIAPELGKLLTQEQGKPLARSIDEFERAARLVEGISAIAIRPEVLATGPRDSSVLHYRPLGVVGAITPWNAPIVLGISKVAQALYTGNTIVVKPSPYAPLATMKMAEMTRDLFPPGVLNVVSGGNDLGRWMTEHPGIAKISFTGSNRSGKLVMASCAASLKRVTLELGGNDAAIVLDDADVTSMAPAIFWAAFANSGQICAAIKRLYVHDSLYDAMVDELAAIARSVKVGSGSDPSTQIGPLQNSMQFGIVNRILDDTRTSTARIVEGGHAIAGDGYFVQPTIVADATEGMRIVDEEPFGPVLPVLRYSDIDDAIERANNTTFGLGSSVWGQDLARAQQVAERLEAGTTWINSHMTVEADVPFGGIKQSGMGVEYSALGLKAYMDAHVIRSPVATKSAA